MATSLIPADAESLDAALSALEGVEELRSKLAGRDVWLVGGAVRDLLLGAGRADLDLVVEGDASEVAALIGAEPKSHERFGTAVAYLGDTRVDVAAARSERYPHPGALPEVEPAPLEDDLARRDFTLNAMALPLNGPPELLDPHGGILDLAMGVLRVLHHRSFEDDPTRALRAARYAAHLDLKLEEKTAALVRETKLNTVSDDRVIAELRRLVAEEAGPEAIELLYGWGLADVGEGAGRRLRTMRDLLRDPAWSELVAPVDAFIETVRPSDGSMRAARELAGAKPTTPSTGVALARARSPVELAIARLAGATWLDDWAIEWRHVRLEIDGDELIEAGVPEGPAVGRGLEAALRAKLDGEISTRDEELRVALAAAAAT